MDAGPVATAVTIGVLTVAVVALSTGPLFGTTDTTFQGPLDAVSDMVSGVGGQLDAALAIGAALVGSLLRFNPAQLPGTVGVGVAASAGVGIVTSLAGTAVI